MSDMVIRGFEIPKTGSRVIEINFRGEVFELFKTDDDRGGFLKSRKLEAIELPEPHGELVDKNKFLEVVEKFRDAFEEEGDADFVRGLLTHPMVKPVLEASK